MWPVLCMRQSNMHDLQGFSIKADRYRGYPAMSLKDLSFPISDLTWDHYWVIQEELGISETQADTILTQVLGPNPYEGPVS